MFTADPKLERLEAIPLFAGCTRRELRTIGRLGDTATRDAGTVLIEQGGWGGETFVIVDGTVTVSRDGRLLATLGPGDVVGEIAVLAGGRRTATVTADTSVELLVFDPRAFKSLLAAAPDVTRRMLTESSRRLRDVEEAEVEEQVSAGR